MALCQAAASCSASSLLLPHRKQANSKLRSSELPSFFGVRVTLILALPRQCRGCSNRRLKSTTRSKTEFLVEQRIVESFEAPLHKVATSEDVLRIEPAPVAKEKERGNFLLPALSILIAGAVLLGNPTESLAAGSAGRVGGSKFKSSSPSRSYSPPRSSGGGGGGTRSYNNYNLNINPPIRYAPPVYGGAYGGYYGGGLPFFGGGVPFFGPSVYVGGGGLLQFLLVPIVLYVVFNVVGSFLRNRD